MKVAVVGSRTFPVIKGGPAVFDWLKEHIPLDYPIYTRGSEGFDRYLAEGARFMGYTVIEMKGTGGADNYLRDVRLVEAVDEVHGFFDIERVGEGGTQHVIDKALDHRKPSYSYVWDGRIITLVGSDDGEDSEGEAPGPAPSPAPVAGPEAEERARPRSAGPPVWPDERGRGDLPF